MIPKLCFSPEKQKSLSAKSTFLPCLWKFRSLFQTENWGKAEKRANFRLALPNKFPSASFRAGKAFFPSPRENAGNSRGWRDGHGVGMQIPLFGCCCCLGTTKRRGQCRLRSPVSPARHGKLLDVFPEGAGHEKGTKTRGKHRVPPWGVPAHPRGCPKSGEKSSHHSQAGLKWPEHKRIGKHGAGALGRNFCQFSLPFQRCSREKGDFFGNPWAAGGHRGKTRGSVS